MTDDERITTRVASSKEDGRVRAAGTSEQGYSESIDGRKHPELFLPYELFDRLLLGLNADQNKAVNAHSLYDQKLKSFGYDEKTFWSTLRAAAQPYLTLRAERDRNGPHHTSFTSSTGHRTFVPVAADACAARIVALAEARRVLGGKTFDHFLYAAVAPEIGTSSGASAGDRADQLRYMAVGCK